MKTTMKTTKIVAAVAAVLLTMLGSACLAQESNKAQFEWKITDEVSGDDIVQVATLKKICSMTGDKIVIPPDEKGVRVVGVEEGAFETVSATVREIVLPPSVKHIGGKAFAGCKLLEKIVIPEGVESLGRDCFEGCSAIKVIHIPTSVSMFSGTEIGAHAGVKRLEIPSSNNTSVKIKGMPELEEIHVYGKGKNDEGVFYSIEWEIKDCPQLSSIKLPGDIGTIQIAGAEKCPKLFGIGRWKEGMPVTASLGIEFENESVVGLANLLKFMRPLTQQLTFDEVKRDMKKIKAFSAEFSNSVSVVQSEISDLRKKFGFRNGQLSDVIIEAYGSGIFGYGMTFGDYFSCPEYSPFSKLTQNGRDFNVGEIVDLMRIRKAVTDLRDAVTVQLKEWNSRKYEIGFRFPEKYNVASNYCVFGELALGTTRDWFKSWTMANGYEMKQHVDGELIAVCPDKTLVLAAFENYGRGKNPAINQIALIYPVDSGENTKEKIQKRMIERLNADGWITSIDNVGHLHAEHWIAGVDEDAARTEYMTYRFTKAWGGDSAAQDRTRYEERKRRLAGSNTNNSESGNISNNQHDQSEEAPQKDRVDSSNSGRIRPKRRYESNDREDKRDRTVISTTNITDGVRQLNNGLKKLFSF